MNTPLTDEPWCGTPGGYHRHRNRDEEPCTSCAAARSASLKAYRERKAAGVVVVVTPEERFWSKVEKADGCACWVWTAGLSVDGYGQFTINKRPLRAHRYAYEQANGPIPDGLVLDHLCRNRRCVRPDHLEPVTNRENVLRGVGLSAIGARRTHCVNGHAFDAANTYVDSRGHRICRACRAAKQRRYAARKKARNG